MELTAGLPHEHCTSEIETSVYVRLPKGEQPNHKCLSCVLHCPHKTCIMSATGRESEVSLKEILDSVKELKAENNRSFQDLGQTVKRLERKSTQQIPLYHCAEINLRVNRGNLAYLGVLKSEGAKEDVKVTLRFLRFSSGATHADCVITQHGSHACNRPSWDLNLRSNTPQHKTLDHLGSGPCYYFPLQDKSKEVNKISQ